MQINDANLSFLTEAELQQIDGGGIGLLIVCFAAGLAIGLAIV